MGTVVHRSGLAPALALLALGLLPFAGCAARPSPPDGPAALPTALPAPSSDPDPGVEATREHEEAVETVPLDGLVPASLTAVPALERAPGADVAEPGARPRSAMARRHELVYVVGNLEVASGPLDESTRAVLDQLADRLRLGDADFRLEVQGYGAGDGAAAGAEVVRRYLLDATRIPAERTAVVPLSAAEPRVAVLVLR